MREQITFTQKIKSISNQFFTQINTQKIECPMGFNNRDRYLFLAGRNFCHKETIVCSKVLHGFIAPNQISDLLVRNRRQKRKMPTIKKRNGSVV